MKIIQVSPKYYPYIGGLEKNVIETSEGLLRRGHEVEVVASDPSGELKKEEVVNGVKVTRLRSLAPGDAFNFCPSLHSFLKKKKCDILHIHGYHSLTSYSASRANEIAGKVVFSPHYHGRGHSTFRNLLIKPYKFFGAKIFRVSDAVICNSRFEMLLLKRDFDVPERAFRLLPPGVNLEEFRIGSGQRDRKIMYAGRIEKYKGIQYLIQALPYLEDVSLEVIGEGPYKKKLEKIASSLGLENRVTLLSRLPREELLERYRKAGVFAMLSPYEAYGLTIAEALLSGTPCVVVTSGAPVEFVDNEMCFGIELPVDVKMLADKISEAMRSGHRKYEGKIYDWSAFVERLIKIYAQLFDVA